VSKLFDSTPFEVEPEAAASEQETAVTSGVGEIEGRSLGQIAWMRLKRDRV
jgi:peptide/nickel transport system permease protein